MKRIVIAGATGLVGSHLLPLFDQDDELHLLARNIPDSSTANRTWYEVNLLDHFDLDQLPTQIDAVIYLAQSPDFRDFPDKALAIFDVNVRALLRLLGYAQQGGASKFVSVSSGGVYGTGKEGFSEERSIPARGDVGFYLSTKLCGEILAENYANFMDVSVLRPFFIYGEGQDRSMLVPRLFDNVKAGRVVTLQGSDGIKINPVHASDAARSILASLDLSGFNTINVAGPDVHSIREICEMIGDRLQRRPIYEAVGAGQDLVADITAMSELLIAPRCRLSDHLTDLA